MKLVLLRHTFAICRLAADQDSPAWATGEFVSVTRTAAELSIVCRQDLVPGDVAAECGWRCLRVAGKLDFSAIGVLASLAGPLAEAEISIFVVSTYDTDYVLVQEAELERTIGVLQDAGQQIVRD